MAYGFETIIADKNSAEWKAFEKQAFDNSIEMSQFYDSPEKYMYFDRLREICFEFSQKHIQKDELSSARQKIYADYEKSVADKADRLAMHKYIQDKIKKSEECRAAINKSDDKNEMLKLAIECIANLTDDKLFLKNIQKII